MGGATTPATVRVVDESGHLVPALYDVFDLVKQANAILATGDISAPDAKRVAQEARARGLQKVVITHPETWIVVMPLDDQLELARLGCCLEHCYATIIADRGVSATTMAHNVRAAGVASAMLATDFGKLHQPPPVEGLRAAIAVMLSEGFSPSEVRQMVRDNPQALLAG